MLRLCFARLAPFALLCLTGCATSPTPEGTLTRKEARAEACPQSVLEAGASPSDCYCVEEKLYALGQKPDALVEGETNTFRLYGDETGERKIAIGVLRLTAFEQCGLFEPDHPVAKNL